MIFSVIFSQIFSTAAMEKKMNPDQNSKNLKKSEFPFIILRHWHATHLDRDFFDGMLELHDRYPGVINEIWFCCGTNRLNADGIKKEADGLKHVLSECRKRNINFALQQGVTLGHPTSNLRAENEAFPDDMWVMNRNGERIIGLFCPSSEKVYEYLKMQTEIIMKELKPDAYWPDDDFRLSYKNVEACFCPRCVEKFNKLYNCDFDRNTLGEKIFGEKFDPFLRKKWCEFNGKMLESCIKSFREAVDNNHPECRLGLQLVYSSSTYDGKDNYPMLNALSGCGKHKIGIRPGAGWHNEFKPRDIIYKALDISREVVRSKKYGFIGQICPEVENYPHLALMKTPAAQLTECAMMLYSGADSLALYFGEALVRENHEIYDYYFRMLYQTKPFLETIRDMVKNNEMSGIALYLGSNPHNRKNWRTIRDDAAELSVTENSMPLCSMDSPFEAVAINLNAAQTITQEDLQKLFSAKYPVIIDIHAWEYLQKQYPEEKTFQQVKSAELPPSSMTSIASEIFGKNRSLIHTAKAIYPQNKEIIPLSGITDLDGACGSCIIPTNYGGKVLLIQTFNHWTSFRRECIADALDKLVPGRMGARLLTSGFPVCIRYRKDDKNRTTSVLLMNLSMGETMPLKLSIRNPEKSDWQLLAARKDPLPLKTEKVSDDEIIISIPEMPPFQLLVISPK